jgi:hypothetical protein
VIEAAKIPMQQASKSDMPPAESTARASTVNALTLPALFELNYALRARAISEVEQAAAEPLANDLGSRVLQWLDEQHSTTPPVARFERGEDSLASEAPPVNVHLSDK